MWLFLTSAAGRILMCNFADMGSKGSKAVPGFSVSEDGGITWGEHYPGVGHDGKEFRFACGCLVQLSGGKIGLATYRMNPEALQKYDPQMVFRTSDDLGRTWSAPVATNAGMLPAHALHDAMIRTTSGRILLPVYDSVKQVGPSGPPWPYTHGGYNPHGVFVGSGPHTYDPALGYSYVLYSDDDGVTWQRSKEELFIRLEGGRCATAVEPTLTEVTPGTLLMVMRTRLGRHFQSWSDDNGTTWSRPEPTQLSGCQHPAQIRTMPNGDLLVVWAQHSYKEQRQGFMRTRLSTAVSRNHGVTWEFFQNVDSIHEGTYCAPGPIEITFPEPTFPIMRTAIPEFDGEFSVPMIEGYGARSYPSVLVTEDRVLIYYSYQYYADNGGYICKARMKVFPLSWLYGGLDPNNDEGLVPKIRRSQEKKKQMEEHSGKA